MSGQLIDVGQTSLIGYTVHTHLEGTTLNFHHLERNAVDGVETGDGIGSCGVVLHTLDEGLGSVLELAEAVFEHRAAVEQEHYQCAGIGALYLGDAVS